MKRAIILLSGGIDSATTLFLAKKKGFQPQALIFDYGQRHKKEIECAKKLAKKAHTHYKILKLSFPKEGTSLVDRKTKIPTRRSLKEIKKEIPSTYVPARNLVFLSIAASFAESMKAHALFIGAHTEDYSGYPDCRKGFFGMFKKTITAGMKEGKRLRIYTPLLNKDKKEIIKLGIKLKVPFEFTWSCYKGGKKPCGVCDSCFFRKKAFEELKITDPYFK